MEVKGAGLFAKACYMLCQDCWAFRIAHFCTLNERLGLSSGSHWSAQESLLWQVVVSASRGEPRVALLS
jgi:hypothetical protein